MKCFHLSNIVNTMHVSHLTPFFQSLKRFDRVSKFHTTFYRMYDIKWREDRQIPLNPTSYGPLTNQPDYTFLDGRPTPLGSRQHQRVQKQRMMAQKIVTLCKEMDFAKDRYRQIQQQKEEGKRKIIENKLKPKGHLLFKK